MKETKDKTQPIENGGKRKAGLQQEPMAKMGRNEARAKLQKGGKK